MAAAPSLFPFRERAGTFRQLFFFAAMLLSLAVTGPFLWGHGWRRRGEALRIRSRPETAFVRDLHAVTGVLSCGILAILVVTASYFTYRDPSTSLIHALYGEAPLGQSSPAVIDGPPASLQAVIRSARLAVTDAWIDEMRPSRSENRAASVSFRLPGGVIPGRHRMYLHPVSGGILRIDFFDYILQSARWTASMGPLHYGVLRWVCRRQFQRSP